MLVRLSIRSALGALGIVGFATGAAAQQPAAGSEPPASLTTEKSVASGRSIFHGDGNCLACHGQALEGGPIAPTLRAHKWKNGDGSYDAILHIVMTGVDGTAMVSHPGGISDPQAKLVAAYVWAVSHDKAKP
ncbi:MAG: c-type cytochrome [Gemmatimonadales bacterium]